MNQHVALPPFVMPELKVYPDPMLEKRDVVQIDGLLHAFVRRDPGGLTLETLKAPQSFRPLTRREFWELYFSHRLTIQRGGISNMSPVVAKQVKKPLEHFPKAKVDKAMWRLFHVRLVTKMQERRLVRRRDVGYKRAARLGAWLWRRQLAAEERKRPREMPLTVPGWSTLRGWQWKYESSGGNLAALVDADDEKGTYGSKLDGRVEAIVAKLVESRFLTREEIPLAAVHQEIAGHVMLLNDGLPPRDQLGEPAYGTVAAWIKRHYNDYEVLYARKGPEAAEQALKLVRKGPVGLWPMHTIQMDYVRLDLFAIDKKGSPLFGTIERSRPWVVAAICTLTGMIVGFHITFEPPCWQSAMAALRHAVMPKDISGIPGILSDYPCMGGFKKVLLDNEKAFRCRSLEIAVASLKAEVEWGPAGKARRRGKIERFFRTVNHDFVSFTPGRSFSNPGERGDYEAEKLAAFELHEIHERFTRWVVDIRHNTPNGLFGLTPLQKWDKFGGAVHVLDKAADLDALLAISVQRTIQREGIRVYGLRFRSKVLEKLLQRSGGRGREYAVKINPDELLWVLLYNDMTEKWEYIPCDTPEYVQDIGLEEWRRQCILARKLNGGKSPARRHLLEARRLLNEEAARRGAVPRKRIAQREIEEYQEQVDDPLFEILDEDRPKRRSRTSARAANRESLDPATTPGPDRDPAPHKAYVENTPPAEPPGLESVIADDDWDHDGDIHDPDDPDDPRNWR